MTCLFLTTVHRYGSSHCLCDYNSPLRVATLWDT